MPDFQAPSSSVELASKNNPYLKEILLKIFKWQSSLTLNSGIDPKIPVGTQGIFSLQPPDVVQSIDVVGQDGKFKINIIPAFSVTGPVFYKLQTSETQTFETSTTLITYGPSLQSCFEIVQPQKTLYFKVFSKYINSDWSRGFIAGPFSSGSLTTGEVSIRSGTGAPSNSDGSNGDFYLRKDGAALTTIYQKRVGTWVGIV